MKAVTFRKYGPPSVLKLEELQTPVPKDNEVLIRIYGSAVNSGDYRIRKADPFIVRLFFGLFTPRIPILGVTLAGVIEKTGNSVTKFKIGDRVFGMTGMSFGAYAEYKCLKESATLCEIPPNISYVEAATIPFGALTCVHFLKLCQIKPGQKILIYGASGSVGTAAIQYAKYLEADITAVCSSSNFDLVRGLGANRIIDYKNIDFAKEGILYDVIFETVGKTDLNSNLRALNKKGTLILGSASFGETLKGYWISLFTSKRVLSGVSSELKENLTLICKLISENKFRPVIDKIYPLERLAEAHEYVEAGHKKGNVGVEIK